MQRLRRCAVRLRSAVHFRSAGYFYIATCCVSCLPSDDRPDPGDLVVYAAASERAGAPIALEDGWTLTWTRFLSAVGQIRLSSMDRGGDTCNAYSSATYTRLFDFTVVERERVGLVFGLGQCAVEFDFRPPDVDTLLGPGVTAADRERMRFRDNDTYANAALISVVATGELERGDERKHFDWAFRRRYELTACMTADAHDVSVVDLVAGTPRELTIVVHPEDLFRSEDADDAPLVGDPVAMADADDDGTVTLDELDTVALPETDHGDATLGALIYTRLLPRVFRVDGAIACEAERED